MPRKVQRQDRRCSERYNDTTDDAQKAATTTTDDAQKAATTTTDDAQKAATTTTSNAQKGTTADGAKNCITGDNRRNLVER